MNLDEVWPLVYSRRDKAVRALYKFAGETDAQIAVASYRKSHTIWCKPEAEHGRIAARGLVHPLLKNAVGNDFILEDRAILTGRMRPASPRL